MMSIFRVGLAALFACCIFPIQVRADEMKVTVVAILASDRHKDIDPKLVSIAEEVRKRDQSFQSMTGWKIERATTKTIPVDKKETFQLVGDVAAEITIVSIDPKEKKAKIMVKCPHCGEITYSTISDKYFPVITRFQTDPNKERLIFAVMVKPVPPKAKDKEKDKTPDKAG